MTRSGRIDLRGSHTGWHCLNPSFSGWPALGDDKELKQYLRDVLIPLLVDDPLWDLELNELLAEIGEES